MSTTMQARVEAAMISATQRLAQMQATFDKHNTTAYTANELLLLLIASAFGLYVTLRLFAVWAVSTKLNIQLRAIPTPSSRYPFSHFVDLISGNPWRVLDDWMVALKSRMIRFQFGQSTYIVVSDVNVIKHVMDSRMVNGGVGECRSTQRCCKHHCHNSSCCYHCTRY